jgi:hypothetical protein
MAVTWTAGQLKCWKGAAHLGHLFIQADRNILQTLCLVMLEIAPLSSFLLLDPSNSAQLGNWQRWSRRVVAETITSCRYDVKEIHSRCLAFEITRNRTSAPRFEFLVPFAIPCNRVELGEKRSKHVHQHITSSPNALIFLPIIYREPDVGVWAIVKREDTAGWVLFAFLPV